MDHSSNPSGSPIPTYQLSRDNRWIIPWRRLSFWKLDLQYLTIKMGRKYVETNKEMFFCSVGLYIYILDISCYLTSPVPIYATKMATKSQAFPGHVEPFKNGFLGSKLESTPSPIISIITFPTNPRFTGPQTFLVYKCRIVANCTWKYSWERYYS